MDVAFCCVVEVVKSRTEEEGTNREGIQLFKVNSRYNEKLGTSVLYPYNRSTLLLVVSITHNILWIRRHVVISRI